MIRLRNPFALMRRIDQSMDLHERNAARRHREKTDKLDALMRKFDAALADLRAVRRDLERGK